jgi:hypothetical protein
MKLMLFIFDNAEPIPNAIAITSNINFFEKTASINGTSVSLFTLNISMFFSELIYPNNFCINIFPLISLLMKFIFELIILKFHKLH